MVLLDPYIIDFIVQGWYLIAYRFIYRCQQNGMIKFAHFFKGIVLKADESLLLP